MNITILHGVRVVGLKASKGDMWDEAQGSQGK